MGKRVLRTRLCDMLGIEHPILLAGMGGVSYAEVCAAVSEAADFAENSPEPEMSELYTDVLVESY